MSEVDAAQFNDEALVTAIEARKANLSPEHRARLAAVATVTGVRQNAVGALSGSAADAGTPAVPESPEVAILKRCQQEYEGLPADAKGRLTWNAVSAKLMANEGAKLKKANAMQGGGHLFHITEKGEVLFKDKGVEPVMYGWDKPEGAKDRQLVQIYGRDSELMNRIKQWANAPEIEARVTADGYELFEDDGDYRFSEEMKRAAAANEGGLFVASQDRQIWRDSVLKNARYALFAPGNGNVHVHGANPEYRPDLRGAVRLLRV